MDPSHPLRYQGREGWAPASYLKKMDIQSQKQSAGSAAHASTNDLDGFSRQNQQNNAAKENKDNGQKENRLSLFSDNNKSSKSIELKISFLCVCCCTSAKILIFLFPPQKWDQDTDLLHAEI